MYLSISHTHKVTVHAHNIQGPAHTCMQITDHAHVHTPPLIQTTTPTSKHHSPFLAPPTGLATGWCSAPPLIWLLPLVSIHSALNTPLLRATPDLVLGYLLCPPVSLLHMDSRVRETGWGVGDNLSSPSHPNPSPNPSLP